MTAHDRLLSMIDELAGPLGPFTTPAQRADQVSEFLKTLTASDVDDLIAIALSMATSSAATDFWLDHKQLLVEEAIVASCTAPDMALPSLIRALQDPSTRPIAIDVIGALRSTSGVAPLLDVLDADPTNEELVRLAAALGEIGGQQARSGLGHIVAAYGSRSDAIESEVNAALQNLDR